MDLKSVPMKALWTTAFPEQVRQLKKAMKRIRPISKSMISKLRVYHAVRRRYLEEQPKCVLCGDYATDVHHKRGRGRYLLVVESWLPLCRPCHIWVENNPKEALELNLRESRSTK